MQESVTLTQLQEVPYVVHLVHYISGHSPDLEHAAPKLHLEFVEGGTLEKKIELCPWWEPVLIHYVLGRF